MCLFCWIYWIDLCAVSCASCFVAYIEFLHSLGNECSSIRRYSILPRLPLWHKSLMAFFVFGSLCLSACLSVYSSIRLPVRLLLAFFLSFFLCSSHWFYPRWLCFRNENWIILVRFLCVSLNPDPHTCEWNRWRLIRMWQYCFSDWCGFFPLMMLDVCLFVFIAVVFFCHLLLSEINIYIRKLAQAHMTSATYLWV